MKRTQKLNSAVLLLAFFFPPSCVIYHPPFAFPHKKREEKNGASPLSFFPEVTSPSPLTTWSDWLTLLSPPTCSLQKKSREKTVSVRPCTVKKGHLEEKKALFCWFILVLYLSLSLCLAWLKASTDVSFPSTHEESRNGRRNTKKKFLLRLVMRRGSSSSLFVGAKKKTKKSFPVFFCVFSLLINLGGNRTPATLSLPYFRQ